jgi:hypothetical protein
MPGRLIPVSELVDRCSPPSEEHRALWLRRARQWSDADILPTAKRQRQGTGRHRLYDFDTIYRASVLFRFADLGLPVGVIAAVSRLITPPHRSKSRRNFVDFWKQAKASQDPRHIYLAVGPVLGGQHAAEHQIHYGPFPLVGGKAQAVLNLTSTFAQLKS